MGCLRSEQWSWFKRIGAREPKKHHLPGETVLSAAHPLANLCSVPAPHICLKVIKVMGLALWPNRLILQLQAQHPIWACLCLRLKLGAWNNLGLQVGGMNSVT